MSWSRPRSPTTWAKCSLICAASIFDPMNWAICQSMWDSTAWGKHFGDDVIASAILDRLLHHSEIFAINGPGYRLKVPFQSDTTPRAEPDSSGMSTKTGEPRET